MTVDEIIYVTTCECHVCGLEIVAHLFGPSGTSLSDSDRESYRGRLKEYHSVECLGPGTGPQKYRSRQVS
jgi:hypothetical protein